jgi:hypothetical protein
MKTNNTLKSEDRKAVGLAGTKSITAKKANIFGAPRGRKKRVAKEDDDFADLNSNWDNDDSLDTSWSGSISNRRKSYNDDDESDSYEGTGYARGRLGYDADDQLNNDPYETFRRG